MGIFDKFRRSVADVDYSNENSNSIQSEVDSQLPPPIPNSESTLNNDSLIGMQSSDGVLSIQIVDVLISSKSRCAANCPDDSQCYCLKFGNNNGKKDFVNSEVTLLIENTSKDFYRIDCDDFYAIDENEVSHKFIHFCDKYAYPSICQHRPIIPPHSKINLSINFPTLNGALRGIVYNSENPISIRIGEKETECDIKDSQIEKLNQKISELNQKIEILKEENKAFRSENTSSLRPSFGTEHLVKYKINEDEEWYEIISDEKNYTLSFNREFDKSKSNFNWINVDDPLITLRIDNVPFHFKSPTLISSPVSGLFHYDKNKLIGFGEVICRIRKIDATLKEDTIENLEREEIKQAVYRKERKKMIERETLDELIADGKVFNVISAKNENRMTIPMDVANAVWNRDGGRCCICGSRSELEFDHIIPVAKGGATTFRNLQLLCKTCNAKKSDKI